MQHERNIVHRDIKPENILVIDKSLNVKLADFGLAKIIGEESFTNTLCGTPSYVAPEILVPGDHRRYTRAVDVWSLGVVLYICLCGFPPFSDELVGLEMGVDGCSTLLNGGNVWPRESSVASVPLRVTGERNGPACTCELGSSTLRRSARRTFLMSSRLAPVESLARFSELLSCTGAMFGIQAAEADVQKKVNVERRSNWF
jgi:serine/threonine protein kinase